MTEKRGREREQERCERELRERRRIRKNKKRRQRVYRNRAIFGLCLLALCIGIGAWFAGAASRGTLSGGKGDAVSVWKPESKNDVKFSWLHGGKGDDAAERAPETDKIDGAANDADSTAAAAEKSWQKELPDIAVLYGIYVPGRDWSPFFPENSYCMAPVDGYINAFRAAIPNQPADMTGTLEYNANLRGSGWLGWRDNGNDAGDTGISQPIEAVQARLTGEMGEYYDVLYSVLQGGAWTDWVRNGEDAGVSGAGQQVDGIRISIVAKQPGSTVYAGGIDPSKPMVALTYDDGPSAKATPRILEKLREYGGKATFFMVGQKAEKHPELIRQMVAQGSETANHTYDHTLMTKVDPVQLAGQLQRTNQVVMDAAGISPVLMRPCGGARTDAGMMAVGAVSMPAVLWSVDTLDWKTRDPQNTIQVVLDTVKDGDIILMHDLYETTADASDVIIPALVERGYQLVTVSELASYRGGMLPGRSYSQFRP